MHFMKTVHTAIPVTLIIMGALLLAVRAVFEMVIAGQESYVLAHSPSGTLPRRDLDDVTRYTMLIAGCTMLLAGVGSVLFAGKSSSST